LHWYLKVLCVRCFCADIPAAISNRNIFGWPMPQFSMEPSCQVSVIMPVSMNGDLSLAYIDQSLPCIAASNYNNNQQQAYVSGFVQPMLPEITDPSQAVPQHVAGSLNASSVPRVARPILGAAANLGLPQGNLDKPVGAANMVNDLAAPGKGVAVGITAPITVDVIVQPARPPSSSSDNVPNGRQWPPAVDSPNSIHSVGVGGPSSGSSPTMMQQPLPPPAESTANPSPQFVVPPYCFIQPPAAAVPSTTVPAGSSSSATTVVAPAAGNPAPTSNLCTAGCCHCGQCQPTAPPVGPSYTYTYPPLMIPGMPPFLPGFGYAIPGLPFPPPPSLPPVSYNGTYTQSGKLMYNNPPVFTVMHQFHRPPPPAQAPIPPMPNTSHTHPLKPSPVVSVPYNPRMPPPSSAHVANLSGRRVGTKSSSCFNCGLVGHQANMCPEPPMSSTHTGAVHAPCLLKVTQGDHQEGNVRENLVRENCLNTLQQMDQQAFWCHPLSALCLWVRLP